MTTESRRSTNRIMRFFSGMSVCCCVLSFVFLFGANFWKEKAFGSQEAKHNPKESVGYESYVVEGTGAELSTEQKVNDFLFLSKMLEESTFLPKQNEEFYGISWEERNAEFLALVEATQNDVEFYFVLQRYLCEIKSVHTYIVSPDYGKYLSVAPARVAQNLEEELSEETITAYADKLKKAAEQTEPYKEKIFFYHAGFYYERGTENKIVRVNGSEHIKEELSFLNISYPQNYDFQRQQQYYPFIVLNDGCGADVTLEMSDGTSYALNYSPVVEYRELMRSENSERRSDGDFVYLRESSTAYVKLGNFSDIANLRKVMAELESESEKIDHLIFDLRGNGGGLGSAVLYEVLDKVFPAKIKTRRDYYIPYTEWNRELLHQEGTTRREEIKLTKQVPEEVSDGSYCYRVQEETSVGNRKNETYRIYVLIDGDTASAADWMAHYLQVYMGSVLVGQNTGGEGIGKSPAFTLLPNSRLLVSYFDSYAENPDGNPNSIYGTAPDYYMEKTIAERNYSLSAEEEKSLFLRGQQDTPLRFILEKLLGIEPTEKGE